MSYTNRNTQNRTVCLKTRKKKNLMSVLFFLRDDHVLLIVFYCHACVLLVRVYLYLSHMRCCLALLKILSMLLWSVNSGFPSARTNLSPFTKDFRGGEQLNESIT